MKVQIPLSKQLSQTEASALESELTLALTPMIHHLLNRPQAHVEVQIVNGTNNKSHVEVTLWRFHGADDKTAQQVIAEVERLIAPPAPKQIDQRSDQETKQTSTEKTK